MEFLYYVAAFGLGGLGATAYWVQRVYDLQVEFDIKLAEAKPKAKTTKKAAK